MSTLPTTIKLSAPIVSYKGLLTELTMQEPTGGQYLRIGDPARKVWEVGGQDGVRRIETTIVRSAVRQYIAELCGIDPLHVDQIKPRDIDTLIGVLLSYFRFEEGTDEGAMPADSEASAGN